MKPPKVPPDAVNARIAALRVLRAKHPDRPEIVSAVTAELKELLGPDLPEADEEALQQAHVRRVERDGQAKDGATWRNRMKGMRDTQYQDHDDRVAAAQKAANDIRTKFPAAYFTLKGMTRDVANAAKLPFSTVRDWVRKGEVHLQTFPDD